MKTARRISFLLCAILIFTALFGCSKSEQTSTSPSGGAGRDVATLAVASDSSSDGSTASDAATETETEAKTETETETETEKQTETETESVETSEPPAPGELGESVAALAKQLIGTTFELGAAGPDHFDNPGFVTYCYMQNGVYVPQNAGMLANTGSAVAFSDIAPGDILVFSADIGGDPSFAAIYVGDNCFVACFKPTRPTNIQAIDSYWAPRFITARRVG